MEFAPLQYSSQIDAPGHEVEDLEGDRLMGLNARKSRTSGTSGFGVDRTRARPGLATPSTLLNSDVV